MNRSLANALSYLGHPLFLLTYGLALQLWLNPFDFGASTFAGGPSLLLLIMVFAYTAVIPGVGILLMRPLGLVSRLDMPDKQERIGPYIIVGVFYLWLFKNLVSEGEVPASFVRFTLGATIGLFLVFFVNIFEKISAHAAGWGGLVVAAAFYIFAQPGLLAELHFGDNVLAISPLAVLAALLVLAGAVGTARLSLGAHSPQELYRGYLAGVLGQVLAAWAI